MCRPIPALGRERLQTTATRFQRADCARISVILAGQWSVVRLCTAPRRHDGGALALERTKLSRLLSIHARELSHRPPHTLSPRLLTPRLFLTPADTGSPYVPSPLVHRLRAAAESNLDQAAASASALALAFAGKPFPTNASLAALAHASYAATSAPHRSVSTAFSS